MLLKLEMFTRKMKETRYLAFSSYFNTASEFILVMEHIPKKYVAQITQTEKTGLNICEMTVRYRPEGWLVCKSLNSPLELSVILLNSVQLSKTARGFSSFYSCFSGENLFPVFFFF